MSGSLAAGKEPMVLITQNVLDDIAGRIFDKIIRALFERDKDFVPDIRCTKIRENIDMGTLSLLGKRIKEDKINLYVRLFAEKYVGTVPKKGEAIGTIIAQSIVQPIVQAVLKSQHGGGKKQDHSSSSLIELSRLKCKRVINIHLNEPYRKSTLKRLANKYQDIKLEDVLIGRYGKSKYTPEEAGENYSWREGIIYLNKPGDPERIVEADDVPKDAPIYKFIIDQDKLYDTGMTHKDVLRAITAITEVMVAIHPISEFRFDLIPGYKPLGAFLKLIKQFISMKLKGITGLNVINEKSLAMKDIVKFVHYEPTEDISYVYLAADILHLFPVEQIKNRIKVPLEPAVVRKLEADLEAHKERHPAFQGQRVPKEIKLAKGQPETEEYKRVRDLREKIISAWSKKMDKNKRSLLEEWTNSTPFVEKQVAEVYKDNTGLKNKKKPFHLQYKGRIEFDKDDLYHYYTFSGTMKTKDVRMKLEEDGEPLNLNYLISNDHDEMIGFVGKSGTRVHHEYLYSAELVAAGEQLSYSHITVICRNIFGFNLNPITPTGFLKSPGINALDRLAFQNYKKNLSLEAIKGVKSKTNTLTSAVIVGRAPVLGTNYIKFVPNPTAMEEMIKLYTEAREAQRYEGRFRDIDLSDLGTITSKTIIDPNEFVLPNEEKGVFEPEFR